MCCICWDGSCSSVLVLDLLHIPGFTHKTISCFFPIISTNSLFITNEELLDCDIGSIDID